MARAGDIKSPYRRPDIDRRYFLKTGLKAAAGVAVAGGASALLFDRDTSQTNELHAQVRNFLIADDTRYPEVAVVHGTDPSQLADRVTEVLGGISRFIERGDKVAIKPNIGWDRYPEQAANTNPELVARVVDLCLGAGASEVIVTDASCNDADRSFHKSGIAQRAFNAGARVPLPERYRFREMELGGGILRRWEVYQPLIQADKVINMPIVKHHSLTGVTAGMKNWYGILGGTRNLLHQDIHQSIFDLANFMRPTLTIMDGIRILVRNGPQGGSYNDVEARNVVIAGTDPVACEVTAIGLLGHDDYREFRWIDMANGVLGEADLSRVRFREIT